MFTQLANNVLQSKSKPTVLVQYLLFFSERVLLLIKALDELEFMKHS